MAQALMEFETLNADQIEDIMAGARPRQPDGDGGGAATGSGAASVSPIGSPAGEH